VFTGYLKGLPPDSGYAIRIPVTDEEAGMGQVIVRNLDDKIIAALKAKVELHGHSLERELRAILSAAAKLNAEERLALADRIRAMTPKRRQTGSTLLTREDRDR